MSDVCDDSDQAIQDALDKKVAEVQELAKKQEIGYAGYCLMCGPEVKLPHPRRWCDAACRDAWQAEFKV